MSDTRKSLLRQARVGWVALAVAVAVTTLGLGAAAEADETRTLNGRYEWTGGGSGGPLEAQFTPRAEGGWSVAFHFVFRDRPHTYEGVAIGELGSGELGGEVKTENGRRSFTFEGRFDNGVFRGTHAERGRRTGTLTLE